MPGSSELTKFMAPFSVKFPLPTLGLEYHRGAIHLHRKGEEKRKDDQHGLPTLPQTAHRHIAVIHTFDKGQ